jgi:uncharacterized membrane protein YqhA
MEAGKSTKEELFWMVVIHIVFVISGVLLALMDYIAGMTKALKKK